MIRSSNARIEEQILKILGCRVTLIVGLPPWLASFWIFSSQILHFLPAWLAVLNNKCHSAGVNTYKIEKYHYQHTTNSTFAKDPVKQKVTQVSTINSRVLYQKENSSHSKSLSWRTRPIDGDELLLISWFNLCVIGFSFADKTRRTQQGNLRD